MVKIDRISVAALLLAVMLPFAVQAHDIPCENQDVSIVMAGAVAQDIEICRGFAVTLTVDTDIETVVVGADSIVGVAALSPRVLTIIGRDVGSTNLHLFASDQRLIGVANITVIAENKGKSDQPSAPSEKANDASAPVVVPEVASAAVTGREQILGVPQKIQLPLAEQKPAKPLRVVINAGSAEILYDCETTCIKLDR